MVVRAPRVKVALGKCSLEQLSLLVRDENWRKQDSVQEPSRQPSRSPGSLDRVPHGHNWPSVGHTASGGQASQSRLNGPSPYCSADLQAGGPGL